MNKKIKGRGKIAVVFAMLLSTFLMTNSYVSTAQGVDGFFSDYDGSEYRDDTGFGADVVIGSMTVQDHETEAPLGGGMLILVTAGAGYLLLKNGRENKK